MSSHESEVRLDAVFLKTPDSDYAWVVVVGDVAAELVVKKGRRERLSISPATLNGRVSESRIEALLSDLGVPETEAQYLNSRFWAPARLRDAIIFAETASAQERALNETFAYIGRSMAGMTL